VNNFTNEPPVMNKRREERVSAVLPVFLENATGMTCDVSASGMFLETSASFAIGDLVSFSVEFDALGGKRMLKCRGSIVRTEQLENRIGLAIEIMESTMGLSGRGGVIRL